MDDKESNYIVINKTQEGYSSFGAQFSRAFAEQLKNMLEPSIKKATENIVYNLTDKVSEDRYSDDFSKILNTAFVAAIEKEGCGVWHLVILWVNGLTGERVYLENLPVGRMFQNKGLTYD